MVARTLSGSVAGLLACLAATTSCALSGAPSAHAPAASSPSQTDCAAAEIASLHEDGLVLDLLLPDDLAREGAVVDIVRDGEPWRALELDAALASAAREGPLPFLDADFARDDASIRVTYEVWVEDRCSEPLVVTRTPPPEPAAGQPTVHVIGLGVRLELDHAGPLQIHRRTVHREGTEPHIVEAVWLPASDGPWVDMGLDAGGIYAYSVTPIAFLESSRSGRRLTLKGPRSSEVYAVVQPPDQIAAPPP